MMTELPVMPLTKNDFAQNVFGRRSIRKFDSDFKITQAEMQEILTQAGRAPSSMNLQPWRFVVVDSTAGKTKLHDLVMTNTPQNDTASAMIIVFGVDHPERDDAKIYDAAVAAGTMTPATRDEEVAEIDAYYHTMGDLAREKTISLDAGLVTMQLALVARAHGYDTCIIGGFNRAGVKQAFAPNEELHPEIIVAIGQAAENGYESVRLPVADTTTFA